MKKGGIVILLLLFLLVLFFKPTITGLVVNEPTLTTTSFVSTTASFTLNLSELLPDATFTAKNGEVIENGIINVQGSSSEVIVPILITTSAGTFEQNITVYFLSELSRDSPSVEAPQPTPEPIPQTIIEPTQIEPPPAETPTTTRETLSERNTLETTASGTFLTVGSTTTRFTFLNGTFQSTQFNDTPDSVTLNWTSTGNYTQVINTSQSLNWNTFSWNSSAIGELPNNQTTENYSSGNANMTGNVLLLHFNNDSTIGESDTSFQDMSGQNNDGSCSGVDCPIISTTGRLNKSRQFDGSTDYIGVNYDLPRSSSTVSFWIKTTSNDTGILQWSKSGYLFQGYTDRVFLVRDNITLYVFGGGACSNAANFITGTTRVTDNNWHHVVGTWNTTMKKLYVDGTEEASSATGIETVVDAMPFLTIGHGWPQSCYEPTNHYFSGNMDELSVWTRVLSSTEIQDIYKHGATRLNLSVRSCDDSACSGENYVDVNDTSPQTLSNAVSRNPFLQYRFTFDTDNATHSAEVHNISITATAYNTNATITLRNNTASTTYNLSIGTFANTQINYTLDAITLNSSTTGNYTSQIFDATSAATWNNITWNSSAIGELPNNQTTENYSSGNTNMTGNVLLLHFNNDSALGENDTLFRDQSGLGNNGTCTTCPTLNNTGKLNKTYTFDGTNDYGLIADHSSFDLSSFTIMSWIKTSNAGAGRRRIFTHQSNDGTTYYLMSLNNNILEFGSSRDTVLATGGSALNNNQWHHITVVREAGSKVYWYINGSEVNSQTISDTGTYQIAKDVYLASSQIPDEYFHGNIDEFAIWNRSLSATEIQDIYKRGVTRLNLSVRSCDDSACSDESFTNLANASPQNLNLTNNRYFQYRFGLETDNQTHTPELHNVTVSYVTDNRPPVINFTNPTPANNTQTTNTNATINVSLTEANITTFNYTWNGTNYTIYNDSLVLMMNFDNVSAIGENATRFVDVSRHQNNGTCTSCPTLNNAGKYGKAYGFDGSDDFVNVTPGSALNVTSQLTLAAWIKVSGGSGTYRHIITKAAATSWSSPYAVYALRLDNSNKIQFWINDGGVGSNYATSASTLLADGSWQHVVATFDGTSEKIYLNGNLDTTNPLTASITTSSYPLYIGNAGVSETFNGDIDEVSIYNRSLSAAEISQLYISNLNKYGTENWTFISNHTSLAVGTYNYSASATDIAGNTNTTGTQFLNITSGNTAPNITLNSPANNSNTTAGSAVLNATPIDAENASVTIRVYGDGALLTTLTNQNNNTAATYTWNGLTIGVHNWTMVADDGLLNSSTNYFYFTYNNTAPNISFNSPSNNSYISSASVTLNATPRDAENASMTVRVYGNGTLLTTLTSQANNTPATYEWSGFGLGTHNWTMIADDGLLNSSTNYFYFTRVNTTVLCEVGGPYEQNAQVLAIGNVTDGTVILSNQQVNITIYNQTTILSTNVSTLQNGTFQTNLTNLQRGNYTVNFTTTYQGQISTCQDTLQLGQPANLHISKIATITNITNTTITYNISLITTNRGGTHTASTTITDTDSSDSPYSIGVLQPNTTNTQTYLKTYTRNDTTTTQLLAAAQASGTDNFTSTTLTATSSTINISIPGTPVGKQITITKNIVFINETSLNVTYNITDTITNSGDENLSSINFVDNDLSSTAYTLEIAKGQSTNLSSTQTIAKAASNEENQFAIGTATVSSLNFYSNRPKISISGYGGPADAIVDAPASVTTQSQVSASVTVLNQNQYIGQDFTITYYITNEAETVNYTSGQQTVYVSANGTTISTATLTAPATGTYRFKANVTWAGGSATGYDTFQVTAATSSSSGGTNSGSSGSSANTPRNTEQQAPAAVVAFRSDSATFSLRKGDTVTFNINQEQHTLTILALTPDKVTIRVASTPREFTLKSGQSMTVDANDDSTTDILVKLLGIDSSGAHIILTRLAPQTTLPAPPPQPPEPELKSLPTRIIQIITRQDTTKQKVLLWVVVIETVLVAFAVLLLLHKPKPRKRHYY